MTYSGRPPEELPLPPLSALAAAGLLLTALSLPASAGCLVAVDVGHSPKSPGADSARGVPEYSFNLQLGTRLVKMMDTAGLPVTLLTPPNTELPLQARPQKAALLKATLLISIHHDSAQSRYVENWQWEGQLRSFSDRFSGYGLFVSAKNGDPEESLRVATAIGDELLDNGLRPSLHHAEAIPGEGRPLVDRQRGIYRYDDLVVLKAAMPAVLVEAGLIVNRAEELDLTTIQRQDKTIAAIALAAAAHCDRVERQPR